MHARGSAAGIVVAGGSGNRLGSDCNKAYLPLAGRCLVSWALDSLAGVPSMGALILVIRARDRHNARWVLEREVQNFPVELVVGGSTRHESERNGLRSLAGRIDTGEIDTVLIHDAARPLAGADLSASVLHAARRYGGAVPALPADDIIEVDDIGTRQVEGHRVLVSAQTPQGFSAVPLLEAFEAAALDTFDGSDTASCVKRFSDLPLRWIRGDERNVKITYPQDFFLAEQLLAAVDYQVT